MRTRTRSNERGASVAIMAVSLFAMLGMAALAVDIGMLLKVRSDAQRVADAAALAGAAEYLDPAPAVDKREKAADSALVYAARNYVGWQLVDTAAFVVMDSGTRRIINAPETYIQSIPDEEKVRVWVRREATATWFGNLLGLDFVPIAAMAAAQVRPAKSAKCVKPFAIPDIWDDFDDDNAPNNELYDFAGTQGDKSGEDWGYETSIGDRYARYKDLNNPNPAQWTGYGSAHRNWSVYGNDTGSPPKLYWDDYGRPMAIKMSNPQETASPGFFYPWTMPYDSTNPDAYGGQQFNNGAQWYEWSIANCNPAPVEVSDIVDQDSTYLDKPGNMIGPTAQGIEALIEKDSLACWKEIPHPQHMATHVSGVVMKRLPGNSTCDQPYNDWETSPRVALVPLFDPSQITSGRTRLEFNNMAQIFIEGQKNPHEPVMARFMFFAKGTAAGPGGSLIKVLQLVE